MFNLTSDITIGSLRFSGVHQLMIRRSIYSLADTATITIPSLAKIMRSGASDATLVATANQFKEGDPVVIKLGYNGNLKTEFAGFVKEVDTNKPTTVYCEGYSWLLKRTPVDTFLASTTLQQLVQTLIKGIPNIKVICAANLSFSNVRFNNTNVLDSLEQLMTMCDDSLRCFFLEPDTLWCGLLHSDLAGRKLPRSSPLVGLRPGYNMPDNSALKKKDAKTEPTQVTYSKRKSDGTLITAVSSGQKDPQYFITRQLTQVRDVATLKLLAQEKTLQSDFTGCEGSIQSFLEPFVQIGDAVQLMDNSNEEAPTYLVESTEVIFGVSGAKRRLELGPSISSK